MDEKKVHNILMINALDSGAPASIMKDIAASCGKKYNPILYFGYSPFKNAKKNVIIKSKLVFYISKILTRLFSNDGFCMSLLTHFTIGKAIKKNKIDIIHIHNIHGCYANLKVIMRYANKFSIPIVWTLHDCWPFTGRCAHFTKNKCDKWMHGCGNCKYKNAYPRTFFLDFSKLFLKCKKRLIENCNIIFVSPSKWLISEFKKSQLGAKKIMLINNGIDASIFFPRHYDSKRSKKIVLAVSFSWGGVNGTKGLKYINELAAMIDLNKFEIVVVGVTDNETTDKNIVRISHTESKTELAELYSNATVFINPTLEDNYPTVNLEALSCGTPVITFDTGGAAEMIIDGINGFVIHEKNANNLLKCILKAETIDLKNKYYHSSHSYDKRTLLKSYINLYDSIIDDFKY